MARIMGKGTRDPSSQLRQRAGEIYRAKRHSLFVVADGTFLRLLPAQWLGGCVLALSQPHTHAAEGIALWLALAVSTLINGVPLARIHFSPGTAVTRYTIAVSQVLFYILLTYIGAHRFDTRFYIFVSLAFLTFYRDWRLLIVVGTAALAFQYIYSTELTAFLEFSAWLMLEEFALILISNRGTLLFRRNAEEAARLEFETAQAHAQSLERTRQLEASNEQYRALLESTSAVPWELDDGTGACTYIGAQVEKQWGWAPESFQQCGFLFSRVYPDDRPAFAQALEEAVATHDVSVECRVQLAADTLAHVRSFIRHAPGNTQRRVVRGISIDITAQKKLESELYQAQKLESVGRLAAGVAHEINTPVQFVSDNCYFLREAVVELKNALTAFREAREAAVSGAITPGEAFERMQAAEQAGDLAFLTENMPPAVERSLEGLDRVATIVRSMKEFSHPNQSAPSSADLNAAIRSTLTVARNEYKYVADVETCLAEIPPVVCYVGEFNQAFLNIIVNAAHAIGDRVVGTERRGLITVTTLQDGDEVEISVRDTGGGIPPAIREKIFDPFFTTKEVGKGTGQGLPIARRVIVEKHQGSLTFETEEGVGTTFIIRLPIQPADAHAGNLAETATFERGR
jgi:PAS domain S-box-containing protein